MNKRNFFKTLFGTALCSAFSKINPTIAALPIKRKLKAKWSVELEQDLLSFHSIKISDEIDREFIESIKHHI